MISIWWSKAGQEFHQQLSDLDAPACTASTDFAVLFLCFFPVNTDFTHQCFLLRCWIPIGQCQVKHCNHNQCAFNLEPDMNYWKTVLFMTIVWHHLQLRCAATAMWLLGVDRCHLRQCLCAAARFRRGSPLCSTKNTRFVYLWQSCGALHRLPLLVEWRHPEWATVLHSLVCQVEEMQASPPAKKHCMWYGITEDDCILNY